MSNKSANVVNVNKYKVIHKINPIFRPMQMRYEQFMTDQEKECEVMVKSSVKRLILGAATVKKTNSMLVGH